jgi:CubicO group peptidase (beta-lactamase class C family)
MRGACAALVAGLLSFPAVAQLSKTVSASGPVSNDPLPRAKPQVGLSSERLGEIAKVINGDVEKGRLPGGVLAVARKDKLVYFESFGFRDKAAGTVMTNDTIFNNPLPCEVVLLAAAPQRAQPETHDTTEYMLTNQLGPEVKNLIANADPTRADYGFGLGLAVRTEPGRGRLLGSVGDFNWPGASGTNWWVDPKEDLVVVFMAHSPGPIRWHYRQVINALVYQAIVD